MLTLVFSWCFPNKHIWGKMGFRLLDTHKIYTTCNHPVEPTKAEPYQSQRFIIQQSDDGTEFCYYWYIVATCAVGWQDWDEGYTHAVRTFIKIHSFLWSKDGSEPEDLGCSQMETGVTGAGNLCEVMSPLSIITKAKSECVACGTPIQPWW